MRKTAAITKGHVRLNVKVRSVANDTISYAADREIVESRPYKFLRGMPHMFALDFIGRIESSSSIPNAIRCDLCSEGKTEGHDLETPLADDPSEIAPAKNQAQTFVVK